MLDCKFKNVISYEPGNVEKIKCEDLGRTILQASTFILIFCYTKTDHQGIFNFSDG
jgi:hypothetical protein